MPYEFTDQYYRVQNDYYIDPPFCSRLLFNSVKFIGSIHDPACGSGNIVRMARQAGYEATGSDVIDRGFPGTEIIDFTKDIRLRLNIVTNPPYNRCEDFFFHAHGVCLSKTALLTRLAFLESQSRYKSIFKPYPPACVLVFSTRPSMPPPGVAEGGGKTAYCWIVWDKSYSGPTTLSWLLLT